jgi:hypothetical protein
VSLAGGALTSTSAYRLSTGSVTVTAQVTGPAAASFSVATSGEAAYFQLSTWDPGVRNCWLQLTTDQLEPFTGVSATSNVGTVPMEVGLIDDAEILGRSETDPTRLDGTLPLASAVALFGAEVSTELGTLPLERIRVETTFELTQGGGLAGYRVDGGDLRTLLRERDLLGKLDDALAVGLVYLRAQVAFDAGEVQPRDISVPGPRFRMSEQELDSGAGCAAAG